MQFLICSRLNYNTDQLEDNWASDLEIFTDARTYMKFHNQIFFAYLDEDLLQWQLKTRSSHNNVDRLVLTIYNSGCDKARWTSVINQD